MAITQTAEGIYKLSAEIRDILFEGLWEIPNGVTLNSYVVKGEKTAIIDGFCGWDGVPETFFKKLEEMNVPLESIDYIVVNHMEPDHSGWIEQIKTLKPDVVVYCTRAAERMMRAFYNYQGEICVVKDGDSVDLGAGRVLEFYSTPNVHWPDSMVTYDTLSKTLFACDAFGSFGIIDGKEYDDDLTEEDLAFVESETVRYYANIVAAFSSFTKKAIDKLAGVPIEIIAPGHGLVWRKNPGIILESYQRYVEYSSGKAKNKVTVLWGSMYGMTERAVKPVLETLETLDVEVDVHCVMNTGLGSILASVFDSSAVILAMPSYENKMFPTMAAVLDELGKKKIQGRKAFRFGSYGWSGGAEKELAEIMERHQMKWEFLPSVEFNGAPKQEDIEAIIEATKKIVGDGSVTPM